MGLVFKNERKERGKDVREKLKKQDQIRGCLIGGAAGDALGLPVEFWSEEEIFRKFKEQGIQSYFYNFGSKMALISDDTQMTMFTAEGILCAAEKRKQGEDLVDDVDFIYKAYLDWLFTQESSVEHPGICQILKEPDLHHRRAPGNTCLSALLSGKKGEIEKPLNSSKGCGGVMRVAPVGLFYEDADLAMQLGAKAAAVTHGHPLGYLPAGAMAYLVNRIVYTSLELYDIAEECKENLNRVFSGNTHLEEMNRILDLAIKLSQNTDGDITNIRKIGEGWVGEEALGIALYAALRYQDDFNRALCAAVNHSGDSDSTGAIAGNLVGALVGYEKLPEKWKKGLELKNTILLLADGLCQAG